MKKNDIVTVEIVDISHDGQGIGRTNDGFVVFVKDGLTEEIIEVHILKVLKNKAFGKIKNILKASPYRENPVCDVFYKCGGCTYQHTTYENELLIKCNLVKNSFKSIAGIEIDVLPVISSENEYSYRNKMLMPVGYDSEGELCAGFYRVRSHNIISSNKCDILDKVFYDITKCILNFMTDFSIDPYNEERHIGTVRNIFIRKAEYTNEIMVGIITNTKRLKNSQFLIESLLSLNKNIVSVFHNINSEKTNVVLGKKTVVLYGKSHIADTVNGLEFMISPLSFYQINTKQSEILYNTALDLIDENNDVIFDLYSGIGTISLNLSKKAKKVYGIESVQEAVNDADNNKRINNIENVEFICDLAEIKVPQLLEAGIIPTTIVLDPPRSGCDEKLMQTILDTKVKKIIYISCNPATLARDIKIFLEQNYEIKEIQPVDMFPKTMHVETVCLLALK